jgi:hypothetical protein
LTSAEATSAVKSVGTTLTVGTQPCETVAVAAAIVVEIIVAA